jgi:RNA polymerase sigma-70 factor (ECF subfamily)
MNWPEANQMWTDEATSNQRTEALVQLYYAYIVRLVQSIVHDPAEAEDIAQETFVAALLTIDNETATVHYKAWLSKIAVNKARDVLRRRQVRGRWLQFWRGRQRYQSDGRLPEDIASQNETSQQLWLAVESLNEKHRLPIVLRYGHHLSVGEIATLLDVKEGTVHSRLHNAQKQLARLLDLDVENVLLLQGGQR